MSAPSPNPDTRELPPGWIQQYNWEYRQWFYVNTREQPPRSSWEHPLGAIPQGYAPPSGPPPPERGYARSPYGGGPGGYPPPQEYGGYSQGYQPAYGQPPQGYASPPPNYSNAPSGGYMSGGPYPPPGGGYQQGPPQGRGFFGGSSGQQQPVYVQQQPAQKKGPGVGTALLAGGAGLVGGALLMDAFEDHEDRVREDAYDQGFQNGFDDNQPYYDDGGGW